MELANQKRVGAALAAVAVANVLYQILKRSETEKKKNKQKKKPAPKSQLEFDEIQPANDGPGEETTKEETEALVEEKKNEKKNVGVEVVPPTTPSKLDESFLLVNNNNEDEAKMDQSIIEEEKSEKKQVVDIVSEKKQEVNTSEVQEPEKEEEEKVLVTENELRYQKMEEFYNRIKQKSFPETEDVTFADIEKMGENCCLIDCRSTKERSYSMLPNAITKEDFQTRKYEILAKDIPIIPYCAIGGRSGKYAKGLKEIYEECDIFNYKGSFIDWCHNGGAVVTRHGEPTKEVWLGNLEDYYPVDTDYIYEK